jgi:hypothetical protein
MIALILKDTKQLSWCILTSKILQLFWLVVYMRACDAAGQSEGLQLCQNPDLEEGN